jgi:hypothetical protein
MRRSLCYLLSGVCLLTILLSCDSQDVAPRQESLASCNDKEYTVTGHFNDVAGIIVKRIRTGPTPTVTLYYIQAPEVISWIPIAPCNLPEEAKQDGLKIRFSGHLLTYPELDRINVEALPLELTEISLFD